MTRDLVVGLSFLLALILLGMLTFRDRSVPWPWQAPPYTLSVRFNAVAGLLEGEKVRVRGLNVGKVGRIEIAENGVDVELIFDATDRNVEPQVGYVFEIKSASTLGGKYVYYDIGSGGALPPGTQLLGSGDMVDPFESITRLVEENREDIRNIVRNFEDITDQANEGRGLLATLLRDGELAENVDAFIASARRALEKLESGDGLLAALLNDPNMAESFRRIAGNVEDITYKLNSGEGPLGMLISDREMSASFRRITRRVEDVISEIQHGEGLLARLINDPTYAARVSSTLENLDEVTRELREGQGLIARLVRDPALAQSFDEALTDIREITSNINNAKGTLGILISSDSLYYEIESAVRALREATEDAREQAPINTFVNVLFSAF